MTSGSLTKPKQMPTIKINQLVSWQNNDLPNET